MNDRRTPIETREQLREKWEARRDDLSSLGAYVAAGPLLDEVLADIDAVARGEGTELLTLTQAAIRSDHSADTLRRMIKDGRLTNYGRKGAPRLRAADLPRKPLRLRQLVSTIHPASRQTARVSKTTPRGGS